MSVDAVLLASFGGPEAPDEVMPFLERVTAGRQVPRDRLEQVAEHYLALGGVSPINAQNRSLIAALRAELDRRALDIPVYWGNRNSAPFFFDAIRDVHADGHRHVVALATSAYSSYSGCRQYREDISSTLATLGLTGTVTIAKARPYFDRAGFAGSFAHRVREALDTIRDDGIDLERVHVLFTTHSIPVSMAIGSGPDATRRDVLPGLYERQHLDVAERVMRGASSGERPTWSLAFQSRSGPPQIPWLEPDVNDALAALSDRGMEAVIVVPIGFVSDHVEVIWDLDREAAATAVRLGLRLVRVQTPGTDPLFVSMLADLVDDALAGRAIAETDAEGICSLTCCPGRRSA